MGRAASAGRRAALVATVLAAAALSAACGHEVTGPADGPTLAWQAVGWSGGMLTVAVLEPSPDAGPGPYPVLLALPWGTGSPDLLSGFLEAYWSPEAASRGYWVVGLVGRASGLAAVGGDVIPALFTWMDQNLSYDPARVAVVGASNGGLGAFWAAYHNPDRFAAVLGLPGAYEGPVGDAERLAGIPMGLWVGELDEPWVAAAEQTVETLTAAGGVVDLEVVPGQGHVLMLDAGSLLDWLDTALGR